MSENARGDALLTPLPTTDAMTVIRSWRQPHGPNDFANEFAESAHVLA